MTEAKQQKLPYAIDW